MAYVQTGYTSESYERERQRSQEVSDMFKQLSDMQACIRVKLEILVRNGGATAAQLKQMSEEVAASYGEVFDRILEIAPPRLTAPTKNRY
jgi:hypothetical protein